MAYVEGMTVHDADSHVMELPGTLEGYLSAADRSAFLARVKKRSANTAWADKAKELHEDPEFRSGDEANLLLRKNYQALGAFRREDRPRALDLLGFASQLVFTTDALGAYGLEDRDDPALALAAARAHNRMMTDYCSVDRRLLPTGYVPLVDPTAVVPLAEEAIALGCKGLMIPSHHAGYAHSHPDLDPLWALAEEAGLPILFHVGGEQKMDPSYLENGRPRVLDFHGGAENFTGLTYMAIPLSVWQTLSVLVMDGVFDRHPRLRFGAIELGASWLPSLMRFMDSGWAAFRKGEERLQKLSGPPSEILRRQLRITPYPHEDTAWIIRNTGEEVCLFSSDFPHVEGGRNPLKRFNESLGDLPEAVKRRFYRDNFIDLMGAGLAADLHDSPALMAA
jgi:predicted TIM-barrel fold metal-dependent hydrolase